MYEIVIIVGSLAGCFGTIKQARVYQNTREITYVVSVSCVKTDYNTRQLEISAKDITPLTDEIKLELE